MTRRQYLKRWNDPKYAEAVRKKAIEIKADGCSGVPDFFLVICDEHDIHYATHVDFYTKNPIKQEDVDQMLQWGIQHFSWFGRWSPMAWWRYKALSSKHGLGLGKKSWETGPERLQKRLSNQP